MAKKEQSLEKILQNLWDALKEKKLTIREVLKILSGRVKLVLLLLLSICSFVSPPGLTVLFGGLISYVGIRMLFGKKIWLPKKILDMKAPNSFLKKVAKKGIWFIQKIQRFTRPRCKYVFNNPFMKMLNGVLITALGLLIAFLPVPLAPAVAAGAVFLISLGLLEDDGVLIMLGYVVCLLTAAAAFGIKVFMEKPSSK